MIKIEEYIKLCNQKALKGNKIFKKTNKIKFSIITPIFNKGETLHRYMRSILKQHFKDIEIILIDDHSSDNSLKVIEEFQNKDERIILLKNFQRKGTLISRNLGVYKSKGDFLLFIDPDDLLSENILNYFAILIEKYDYDLTRFNLYIGDYDLNLPKIVYHLKNKPLFGKKIFFHLFFGFGKLLQLDFYLTNKLIKRQLFIRVLNSVNQYFLKQFMIDCEDGLINFMLYKLSESYYFTRKIGYYYVITKESITHESVDFKKRLKSNFLYFRYIIESTKNNNIEKIIANHIFTHIYSDHNYAIINSLKYVKRDLQLYLKTINLYLDNEFIPLNTKLILKYMKNIIIQKIIL
jgi:glycosyltransferase involved in cell wall biosynthesis